MKTKLLFTVVLLLVIAGIQPTMGQIAEYTFDGTLNDAIGGYHGQYMVRQQDQPNNNLSYVTTTNGQGAQPVNQEGIKLPVSLAQAMTSASSFEIELDFIYVDDFDSYRGFKTLFDLKRSKSWASPGIQLEARTFNLPDGVFEIRFKYADGNGNIGYDKLGEFSFGEPIKINFIIDFDNNSWTSIINDSQFSTAFFPDDISLAIMRPLMATYRPFVSWQNNVFQNIDITPDWYKALMTYDNLKIYAPKKPSSVPTLTAALVEMTDHILGNQTLTQTQIDGYLADILINYQGNYTVAKTEIDNYLSAYENAFEPLFASGVKVNVGTLPAIDRIAIALQQDIFDREFVLGNIENMAGTTFEAAQVYPGSVDPAAPRIASATVPIKASHVRDPGYALHAEVHGVIRPTGYYAAPGEAVTVTVPASMTNQGIRAIVGAHTIDLSHKITSINRFPRIGKKFDIATTEIKVANPFGGAIYIEIPPDLDLGWQDVTIEGAVKSPYFRYVNGQPIDVAQWQTDLTNAHVKWVDVESDKMMFTMPLSATDSTDPTAIMDKWSEMWDAVSTVAGRPLDPSRAEYMLVDRRGPFESFGAGYPMVMPNSDDLDNVSPNLHWNPLRILDENYVEDTNTFVMYHELGHNMSFPTPPGEAETVVQLLSVPMINVLAQDIDLTLTKVEAEAHTRDLAAMNWMIAHNFRNNQPMGCDPTVNSNVCSELRYQIRGGGKYWEISELYGIDGLGAINNVFYEYWANNGGQETLGIYITREEYIQAATEATGENLTSLLHFWGYVPEEQQRLDLDSYPQSDAFYKRLLYYRSIVPLTQAEFEPWHDQLVNTVAGNPGRVTDIYNNYDAENIGQQILDQIDYLLELYFGKTKASPKVFLQGSYLNPNTGEETLMRDSLREQDYITSSSAYLDQVAANPSIFNKGGITGAGAIDDDIVDWVFVMLRDENDANNIVNQQSALLQRDGDVVGTDGASALRFTVAPGNYYLSVHHRNHLGVMTANPIALSDTPVDIDFTDATNEITFGAHAQTTFGMPTNVFGMWAGDVNEDGEVVFLNTGAESVDIKQLVLDVSTEESPFGASVFYKPQGYYAADVNMDGEVIFLNAGNELLYIKDNILAHPSNQIFNSVFYKILQQLP